MTGPQVVHHTIAKKNTDFDWMKYEVYVERVIRIFLKRFTLEKSKRVNAENIKFSTDKKYQLDFKFPVSVFL